MLEIRNLHVFYGGIHALQGVSFSVPKGSVVTLLGANGAGKTTTLRAIMGLVRPREGAITLDGRSLLGRRPHEIVRLGLSLAPEGRRIFPDLTVLENLLLGAYARSDSAGVARDLEFVFSLFPRLKERVRQRGGTLSGGEQQMLAVGRALMAGPKILLLDEPSLGLAPVLIAEMYRAFARLKAEGRTLLLVEQNARAALSLADYGYVLETGRIVAHGSAPALRESDLVRRAYLGV
ncbi:MAG: ABC transporter ATP-binding protein [Candidatus Bipolaricaulota bacterium]|nr:ABC transporter ATP-binding protein [Candidatus Bipolaricaulota bacterium]MCX7844801.1 ABC transporter ATP-binding protein [Candidatus Bipolaricaulota bacterium]MDW8152339.1 ABC transporter ATP-binding protein [Candidatus Bipolaricaulota bacterium]